MTPNPFLGVLYHWAGGLAAASFYIPYRAVRRELLAALDMREMTFGWPTEMIVKAARRRARVVEAPVSYRSRRAGKSKVSGTIKGTVLAGTVILGTTFRYARWS